MELQSIKNRYKIIGNDPLLNRAIEVAVQVASTDLTVLITGESGTGKDVFPKIIHDFSSRRQGNYFAINCGAIPEGTIDSELFGHEKGSFTGAVADRKGYFEIADKGTLFLDEVGELPLSTQARLLRVLENGEYIKVGGSKVMKTDVRIVAATNVNLPQAIERGKFREDLYYRLSTVPIIIPPLRERKDDIYLLFRKFVSDFSERHHITSHKTLTPEARQLLENYSWEGNIRQLKNVTEQISIMEPGDIIDEETLRRYLPQLHKNTMPMVMATHNDTNQSLNDADVRDLLYKILFDMRKEISDLRQKVDSIVASGYVEPAQITPIHNIGAGTVLSQPAYHSEPEQKISEDHEYIEIMPSEEHTIDNNDLSLEKQEIAIITKALEKHNGKRKDAAKELGISERTLYRKINEFGIK